MRFKFILRKAEPQKQKLLTYENKIIYKKLLSIGILIRAQVNIFAAVCVYIVYIYLL